MDDSGPHLPIPAEAHEFEATVVEDGQARRAIFWMLFVLVWIAVLPVLPTGLWAAFPSVLIVPELVGENHFRHQLRRLMHQRPS